MTAPAEVRGQSLEKRHMELKMEASKALGYGYQSYGLLRQVHFDEIDCIRRYGDCGSCTSLLMLMRDGWSRDSGTWVS